LAASSIYAAAIKKAPNLPVYDENGEKVAMIWNKLIQILHHNGCILDSPFMTLSFMALIVIPELKIGERGLFEYSKFKFLAD
jgi:adenine deaminase